MKKWSAHMLTGVEQMTRMMRAGKTCRTDVSSPGCRRDEARGARTVARFAVVAVMTMVLGLSSFVSSAEAIVTVLSSATAVDGTTATYTAPNGTDRVVVAFCTGDGASSSATIGGQGATLIAQNTGTTTNVSAAYYRVIGTGSGENVNIACTVGANPTASAITFGGVDQANPVFDFQAVFGAATASDAPSVIDVPEGGRAAYIQNSNSDNGVDNTFDPPTNGGSWTEVFDFGAASNRVTSGYRDATTAITAMAVNTTDNSTASNRGSMVAFSLASGCSDTNGSSIALTNPTNVSTVSGSISLAATLNNAATTEYSIDGGAWTPISTLWNSLSTHAGSSSAPVNGVTVEVRAVEDECGGYVTDSVTVSVDNTCSESTQSSIIWNATNTAGGDFAGASFINDTDITVATLQYKVTEGSGGGGPFEELEYFDTVDSRDDWGNWTASGTTANGTGNVANGQLGTYNSGQGGNGATLTPSAGTGPTSLHSGTSPPGGFLFIETSGTGPYSQTFTRDAAFDADAYLPNISYAFEGWGANLISLRFQVNHNGGGWVDEWVLTGADANNDGAWQTADINLNEGTISIDGGAYAATTTVGGTGNTYTSGTLAMRYVFDSNSFAGDYALDTIRVYGDARSVETTVIDWTSDLVPGNGNLTDTNTYNLYARGNDPECNVSYYGDSVAQSTPEGTPTTFTWSSCTELTTVNVVDPGVISGTTPIVVTVGGSGGTSPQWSADGGSTWFNSGQSYTPPASCASGPVTFIGRATGTCGTVTDPSPVNGSYDTTDGGPGGDLAVLTVSPSGSSVTGVVNVQMAVGTETVPDSLSNVVLNVTGSTACNDSNSVMTWNSGSSRWEASWDTSACATASVEPTVTLTVSANDSDCGDFVSGFSTVIIDNTCSDLDSTVFWTPPGGTIETPIVVTATSDGIPGFDQVSFDDGATWLPSGSTYTPDVDDYGTKNFWVRAYDTCGKWMYGGPYAVNIDGRLDAVRPLSVTASAAGKTSIRVILRYASDKNNNAETTVRYKLFTDPDIPANWTTVGPVVDGDGSDTDSTLDQNVSFMLTALTSDVVYDLELNTTDADTVDWSTLQVDSPSAPPWTGTVRLTSWADNNMLHNALRFACSEIGYNNNADCVANGGTWNLDRKWVGGWGLPDAQYAGAQYDGFECSTCHMKNSNNIKRVVESVLAPTGSFPGVTVDYQTAVDGASQFGDDSDDHTTSTKACEVCHSKTQYHRFDTSAQVNKQHNNNTDCIRCHEHKVGFRASCDSCHGTPPVSLAGLVTTDLTGSTVYGEHQKHAVDFGFDCKTCHNGWDNSGQMPNIGNLNIGFKVSENTARFVGAVNPIDGGSYEGRPAANGSYTADGTTSTTVTQDTATADMSCAIYCHGYGTPIWNPTSTVACGSCHGAVGSGVGDRSGAPTGVGASMDLSGSLTGFKIGKHATHIDDSIFQTGDPCALCHDGFGYSDSTHVNGTVNIQLKLAPQSLTPTTTGGAGLTGAFTPGVPGVSPGSCDNMDCHGYTPWDSAAKLTCTQACHGYPPTTATSFTNYPAFSFVDHNTPNGEQYLRDNHGQCKYCHGWNDDGDGNLPISGMTASELTAMNGDPAEAPNFMQYDSLSYTNGLHGNATITMNSDGDGNEANDAGYDPATGGCNNAVCHGNDAAHQFNVTGNLNTMAPSDIGPGDCGACHTTGVGGATIVTPTSPHTTVTTGGAFTGCGACHSGHYTTAGGVQIPNNIDVGINYTGTQHGGIKLGGPGTDASIVGKTTEAEICWGCHDLAANSLSEWGTNAAQTGSPVASQYNYGSLSTSNWTTATWTSGKAPQFNYKTGAIQSTHSVNSAGTSAVTGSNYAYTEAVDAVADIRCSYCHDVHDAVGPNGAPYLRGTWWGNPYEEDGAPQSTQSYVSISEYGAVPRGGQNTTNMAERAGGFWIDHNNVRPGTASATVDGTAYKNPTATGGTGTGGAWTYADSAGLCIMCHSNNVDTMDQTTGENLWLGTNGHSNAVVGGNGTNAANIFELRGGSASNSANPAMHFVGGNEPGDSGNFGYRNCNDSQYNYTPSIQGCGENTLPYRVELWGSISYDNTTINTQYHKFSCSKCHNPHASRLPKLMITNCLDTKHNTWDDGFQLNAQAGVNQNRSISNWSSAQNCHRVGGIIPSNRVIPATGGTYPEPVDTGAVSAPVGTGTDYQNRGWNVVTPW